MKNKKCPKCGFVGSTELFSRSAKTKDGYRSWCKGCDARYSHEWGQRNKPWRSKTTLAWREKNKHRWKEYVAKYQKEHRDRYLHSQRKSQLKVSYGLSIEAYESIFKFQNGACAICKGQNMDGKRLAVDHCHSTGKIRGLLCSNCNNGLGRFKDDHGLLEAALIYLKSHQSYSEATQ